MSMRRRQALIAALAPVAAAAGAAEPQRPLPVAVAPSLTPEFVQKLLKLVAEGGGFEWQVQVVPWARALQLAELGQAIAFGVARNSHREAVFEFSETVYTNNVWLVARRDQRLSFARLEDLRGRRICVRRGTSYGDAFDAARGQLFQVEQVDGDLRSRVRMMLGGRCDLVPGSHRSSRAGFERRLAEGANFLPQVEVLPTPLSSESIHFAVAREAPLAAAMARVNTGLRTQRAAIQALLDEDS
ncbi:transporter substrate-binding domain-containing protein [Pelomonas sp. SE-A7]|uniref:substrate-binding periplasmic protein n=1 Tax=Pelomonas sp. SE-A7 TaxID=3054953 RepID=UPI00259CF8CD|nr:transporter substrate-binding domain-containing protein [Pelomonas sp. SE-A7]MDM4766733.1 transporter substrate-binding domain-containing protein [Pelomonas sp. SE-A7]